jgi:hypothetical protein
MEPLPHTNQPQRGRINDWIRAVPFAEPACASSQGSARCRPRFNSNSRPSAIPGFPPGPPAQATNDDSPAAWPRRELWNRSSRCVAQAGRPGIGLGILQCAIDPTTQLRSSCIEVVGDQDDLECTPLPVSGGKGRRCDREQQAWQQGPAGQSAGLVSQHGASRWHGNQLCRHHPCPRRSARGKSSSRPLPS